jgi:hypothetical protein
VKRAEQKVSNRISELKPNNCRYSHMCTLMMRVIYNSRDISHVHTAQINRRSYMGTGLLSFISLSEVLKSSFNLFPKSCQAGYCMYTFLPNSFTSSRHVQNMLSIEKIELQSDFPSQQHSTFTWSYVILDQVLKTRICRMLNWAIIVTREHQIRQ